MQWIYPSGCHHCYSTVVWLHSPTKPSVSHNKRERSAEKIKFGCQKLLTGDVMTCFCFKEWKHCRNTRHWSDIVIFLTHKTSQCKILPLCWWQGNDWQAAIVKYVAERTKPSASWAQMTWWGLESESERTENELQNKDLFCRSCRHMCQRHFSLFTKLHFSFQQNQSQSVSHSEVWGRGRTRLRCHEIVPEILRCFTSFHSIVLIFYSTYRTGQHNTTLHQLNTD